MGLATASPWVNWLKVGGRGLLFGDSLLLRVYDLGQQRSACLDRTSCPVVLHSRLHYGAALRCSAAHSPQPSERYRPWKEVFPDECILT